MYTFTFQPALCGQIPPHTNINNHYNTDLVDTSPIDPASEAYQRYSMDASAHLRTSDPLLTLNYHYLDTPYISSQPMPHVGQPFPHHTDNLHQAPPISSTGFHPPPAISHQLSYPSARTDTNAVATQTTNSSAPSMFDYYAAAPQQLFPTPAELLTGLTSTSMSAPSHHRQHSQQSQQSHQPHQRAITEVPLHTQSPPPPQISGRHIPEESSTFPPDGVLNKADSQRKARQRAIANEVGFMPTDPDTISSHEKKRHYLECLEQYVLYLHEQLRLVQTPPLKLERVSSYRGLSSRSIRTLLVYMQNTNKNLHASTLLEEQAFLDLSAQVMAAHNASHPLRRHSIDVAGVSSNPGYASEPCLDALDSVSTLPSDRTSASASPLASSTGGSPASPDAAMGFGMQSTVGEFHGEDQTRDFLVGTGGLVRVFSHDSRVADTTIRWA
ncbi:hypothetical protein BU15DRAFT_72526 [Melanogaster broomeanus]|nr:hypothetical protein BU15DRAFT_72526 [Melanogaster broomeanus]